MSAIGTYHGARVRESVHATLGSSATNCEIGGAVGSERQTAPLQRGAQDAGEAIF
jgi:hypothetical protein